MVIAHLFSPFFAGVVARNKIIRPENERSRMWKAANNPYTVTYSSFGSVVSHTTMLPLASVSQWSNVENINVNDRKPCCCCIEVTELTDGQGCTKRNFLLQ